MSQKYDDYLKTDYWKAVVNAVKKRDGYRCRLCNSQHDLAAHHRTYEHRGRELDFLDDLTTLCRRCHAVFHGHENDVRSGTRPAVSEIETTIAQVLERRRNRKREKVAEGKRAALDSSLIERDMPAGESILLTKELIERTRTAAHAFTNATLRGFGFNQLPPAGWPKRLIGKELTRDQYRQALEGRYLYNSGKLSANLHR